ncbi:MAG: hypothetical protein KatS3mg088_744 [Patescibacteria group bacterium]|nr:MAG: hypothetical protein KatS3mg088_744 [Patescibacteria group bacterium]
MVKLRVVILITTITIVGVFSYLLSLYARGYRFDNKNLKLTPNGLLVVKSNPEGAQIFINQELKGATNANFNLAPDTYDITVKKEGYSSWNKRLTIKKEEVTEVDAHLFKIAPSLSAVTFNSCINPQASPDSTKIAFIVPPTQENIAQDKEGLWVLENINLPLGFSRDPRRITDGDLKDSDWIWSPDSRQILLLTPRGKFLLDVSNFTPQDKRVNIANKADLLIEDWQKEEEKILKSKIKSTPDKIAEILQNYAENITFSPDETKVLYTATVDYKIPDEIIKPIPGASTQKQERDIRKGKTYVYDIKEDRNFWIAAEEPDLQIDQNVPKDKEVKQKIVWFATSRHLIWAKEGKIIIMDYDGTNRQEVYSGSYFAPFAFPTLSNDRILILTNLGADSQNANLYYLNIK